MGEFQTMHKYFVIFLALVACHGSIFAHGRQIKPLNKRSSPNTNTAGHKDNPHTTIAPLKTTINVPTPSTDKLKVDSPIMPNHKVSDVVSGDSGANHANAFRPTTPGNSPGVGHRKFEGEDKDMNVMVGVPSPDAEASMAEGFKDDFRPTHPGPSSGIGHALQNKNGQLN